MAAYGNPDPSNITGYWLPVTLCTSEIGSNSQPVCQTGSVPSPSAAQCYIRLDIQIAYANIGSVTNPQPILGAVIFHYQRVVSKKVFGLCLFSFTRLLCFFIDHYIDNIIIDDADCDFSRCIEGTCY